MSRLSVVSGILFGGTIAALTIIISRTHGKPMSRFGARMRERWKSRMEHMLERLPEDSPPRLVVSTLPRLSEQNEQILALLREQNDLMRQLASAAGPREI